MLDFHAQDETPMRVLYYSALEGNELSQMIFRNHIAEVHKLLAGYIKLRIREGAFRKVDPMTAIRGFMGMVMGQSMLTRFFTEAARELLDINDKQAAERFTDIFLTGIRATPSAVASHVSGRQRE